MSWFGLFREDVDMDIAEMIRAEGNAPRHCNDQMQPIGDGGWECVSCDYHFFPYQR
ncbi:hypothetical protein [Streptomyces sp. XC 2026]|uniref:hypothetical protein n=1 Tax=Streptomyces sp. XC 2026 TaxID=2782004 RepID=UPI0019071A88|nr:hypothetical protein [Streptomyces sp. XC 2026]QQN79729.1 hypothetical protein IPZ77_21625 [Streptomyces sp. XC 2026]QQN80663.1 hypothetical protein IPZ77_27030 [Streptomyces sp. XC 2026]